MTSRRSELAGSRQDMWASRNDPEYLEGYSELIPIRRWLAKIVTLYHPKSVLELGCNVGANLQAIHQIDPTIELAGLDIHAPAIELAKKRLPQGQFVVGSLYDAAKLFNRKFDIVFTCGVLIHIPPDMLPVAKEQIDALARMASIHIEEHGQPRERKWDGGIPVRWVHDYQTLFPNAHIYTPVVGINGNGAHDLMLTKPLHGARAFWYLTMYPRLFTWKERIILRFKVRGWRALIPV